MVKFRNKLRIFDCRAFAAKLGDQLLFARQVQFVFCSEDSLVVQRQRVAHEVCAFVGAEDNADRRIVAGIHQLALVIIHVHLHLPEVGMRQFVRLEVTQDKTTQNIVVEHEIDMVGFPVERQPLLPRHKRKAAPKLHHEFLEVRDEQAFQVLFKMAFALVQSKKFQHEGIAYHTLRRHLVNRPKRDNCRLLATAFLGPILKQAFIVERVDLALKFAMNF